MRRSVSSTLCVTITRVLWLARREADIFLAMRKVTITICCLLGTALAPASEPKPNVCTPGKPPCFIVYINGMPDEHYEDGNIAIDVMASKWPYKHVYAVTIGVRNDSKSGPIDADPSLFVVQLANKTVINAADMDADFDKRERHDRRMAALGAGLAGAGSGMSQQTGTVYNSDGSTSRVTMNSPAAASHPNPAATGSRYVGAREVLLRRNSVMPGQFVSGNVYFKSSKEKHPDVAYVGLKIEGQIYIFPAPAPTRP